MRKIIIITIILTHFVTLIISIGGFIFYNNIAKRSEELSGKKILWLWYKLWLIYPSLWDRFVIKLFYKIDHSILYYGFGLEMPSDYYFTFGYWRPNENAYDQMLRYFFGLSFVYSCGLIFLEIIIYTLIKKFIKIYKKIKNIYLKKYSKCY